METAVKSSKAASPNISPNTPVSEIRRIFDLQQKNKQNVKNTSAKERRNKLKALKSAVFAKREIIKQAIYDDFRKAPTETEITEIYPVITDLKHAIDQVVNWMEPVSVETPITYFGTSAKLIYEPKGCALIISPWNYPFQLCIRPLIYAVAAGNCAMVKPSEYTPHTTRVIKEVVEMVFPENEVAVYEGDHTVSKELLSLKFDHIFFTGSPAVGKIVMKAAAENLASVTLELGGKSPVIVDETANVKKAARRLAWGKLVNNGQTCIAPDYLFVHENKYDDFIKEFNQRVEEVYGKSAEDVKKNPDYCRIVNGKHQARIEHLIEDAVNKGANVIKGGKTDNSENFISPTVLTDVPADAEIMHEEIFGPVLPVIKYKDLSEPLQVINSKEKPLALYIFSNSNKNINAILQNTSAGGTVINDNLTHNAHPNLPFGGVNNSGIGSSHGLFGFKAFSHERAVLRQHMPQSNADMTYPPYNSFKKKVANFLLKYM